jgi:putative redox protein
MECKVRWTGEGMTFLAETGSNHVVAMDGAPEGGGRNLAPRPMEMVLLGTGGCSAYDVVVILKKSGQDITGCDVKLTSERAESDPKVSPAFTCISWSADGH